MDMVARPFALLALLSALASTRAVGREHALEPQSREPANQNWTVLANTDFPQNGGGPLSPAVTGASAAACADACFKLPECVAVVWNKGSDHGCNFKCSTHGKVAKLNEEAVIVRPGGDTCGIKPPPPPPPPPPTPANLCPATMPADWRAACLGGDLFYEAPPASADSHMPAIGNGYIATFVQSNVIYAGGLFNGDSTGSKGGVSHRATIPAYHVSLAPPTTKQGAAAPAPAYTQVGRALDVRRAVFLSRHTISGGGGGGVAKGTVDEKWYARLDKPSLLVHEVTITADKASPLPVVLAATSTTGTTNDLDMSPPTVAGGAVSWTGANKIGELGNTTTLAMVCTAAPASPVSVAPGTTKTLYFITAIVTSLNSTNPQADAASVWYRPAVAGAGALFGAHAAAWATRWEQGSLEAAGDLRLAQSLNASLYAIRASIRPDWPYGLSPGGLASNAYEGHTFWDQETWMWPPHVKHT